MASRRGLDIATLECGAGRIGLAKCPGSGPTGDLARDLEKFRTWGARAVVTMLDCPELPRLDLDDLGETVERLGMEWYHVPVPDFGVPGPEAEARWRYASIRVRRILSQGGAAILHCRGGLGRTGMCAARLLIDAGSIPDDAVRRVRHARPGAIETAEQLDLVRAQKTSALGSELTLEERVFGCLIGGAVGDAFGYPVEFHSLAEIRERFGEAGLREPVYDDGGRLLVSDDTQMTMFTAEGLIRAHKRFRDRGIVSTEGSVWRAYRRWLRTQGIRPVASDFEGEPGWLVAEPSLRAQRAPGTTCVEELRTRREGASGDSAKNDSKGCGGIMRVAPAGLLPTFFDRTAAFRLGCDLAALTHGHPTGFLAAGAMSAIIRSLLDGVDLQAAAALALGLVVAEAAGAETVEALRRALDMSRDPGADAARDVAHLGKGWVAEEALAVGVYAAARGKDFAEVVRIAANHDGDSDSTASIAGQLHGARYGVSAIPHHWARRLDVLDPLLELTVDLGALSTVGRPIVREYPPN